MIRPTPMRQTPGCYLRNLPSHPTAMSWQLLGFSVPQSRPRVGRRGSSYGSASGRSHNKDVTFGDLAERGFF